MDKYDKLVDLAKRRGFFWQSFEIYGGVSGFIDFGPLGTMLKRRIEEKWRNFFIKRHQGIVYEIETPIIMPSRVFEASGHLEHFSDYVATCMRCGRKFRADHLIEEQVKDIGSIEKLSAKELNDIIVNRGVKCPECEGPLGEVQPFNLLFRTVVGPYSENVAYLRPEAAQGMFVNFKSIYLALREKLPIGLAQIGKVARNEISPRQGPIRLREFTIMEVELFFDPNEPSCPLLDRVRDVKLRLITEDMAEKGIKEPKTMSVDEALNSKAILTEWQAYFMAISQEFVKELGIPEENQVFLAKLPGERAHYSAQTYDQLVKLERWGWVEVAGHAYRTDYDLSRHARFSGQDLHVARRTASGTRKVIPHVVEPSFGSDRLVYAVLEYSLKEKEDRTILSLPRDIAPIQISVFPLVSREKLPEKAMEITNQLRSLGYFVEYDESGSIGRRYARADEVGIPIAITVDYQTMEDDTVTLRDRDTWAQVRVKISELPSKLELFFKGMPLEALGELVKAKAL